MSNPPQLPERTTVTTIPAAPSLKTITQKVFLAGLTPLIPIPFLDEYLERRLLRDAFKEVAALENVTLDASVLETLVEDRSNFVGGCLWTMVKWPVKKLFRTIIYVLTVKDVIDVTARSAHRVVMVRQALKAGRLPGDAAFIRQSMDGILSRVSYSPVSRAMLRLELAESDGWPEDPDPVSKYVGFLHRHGGGGLMVSSFRLALKDPP